MQGTDTPSQLGPVLHRQSTAKLFTFSDLSSGLIKRAWSCEGAMLPAIPVRCPNQFICHFDMCAAEYRQSPGVQSKSWVTEDWNIDKAFLPSIPSYPKNEKSCRKSKTGQNTANLLNCSVWRSLNVLKQQDGWFQIRLWENKQQEHKHQVINKNESPAVRRVCAPADVLNKVPALQQEPKPILCRMKNKWTWGATEAGLHSSTEA